MSNKILFCTGEGIGNVIQCIPTIRTIKEVLGWEVDLWHAFGSFKFASVIPYVSNFYYSTGLSEADFSSYKGVVSTFWTRNHVRSMNVLTKIVPLTMARSEVDTYMEIARDLGVDEKDLIWHGNINYEIKEGTKADVVVMNGYNPYGSANWSIKSYPHFKAVVGRLKERGLSVASLGSPREYIEGTMNLTGLPLKQSLGAIKQAKLVISNDTGMYHAANALEIPNIVLFTATSVSKNYDKRFHIYSKLLARYDLVCRPCQDKKRWNKDCKVWKCQDINPDVVIGTAMDILKRY